MNISLVVLAAGSSSRFGSPKQLALYAGRPLVNWACDAALGAGGREVLVVLPTEFTHWELALPEGVRLILNHEARSGMASSIRVALQSLAPETSGAIFLLGDEPKVKSLHLKNLGQEMEGGVAASLYPDGSLGVPAAFARDMFASLLELRGDRGAKSVIQSCGSMVKSVRLDDPFDVDYPADLL